VSPICRPNTQKPRYFGAFASHHTGKNIDGTPSLALGVNTFPCAALSLYSRKQYPEGNRPAGCPLPRAVTVGSATALRLDSGPVFKRAKCRTYFAPQAGLCATQGAAFPHAAGWYIQGKYIRMINRRYFSASVWGASLRRGF